MTELDFKTAKQLKKVFEPHSVFITQSDHPLGTLFTVNTLKPSKEQFKKMKDAIQQGIKIDTLEALNTYSIQ